MGGDPSVNNDSRGTFGLGGFLLEPENAGQLLGRERLAAGRAEERSIGARTMASLNLQNHQVVDDHAGLVVEDLGSLSWPFADGHGLLRATVTVDVANGERHDLAEPGPGLVEEANHEVA